MLYQAVSPLYRIYEIELQLAGNTNTGRSVLHLQGCQHSSDVLIRVKLGNSTNGRNCRSCWSGMH